MLSLESKNISDKSKSNKNFDIQEMREFLFDIIRSQKFDYIIPIVRKGVRVLNLLLQDSKDIGKIRYSDFLKNHRDELEGRNILLFDDSLRSGELLSDIIDEIEPFVKRIYKAAIISLKPSKREKILRDLVLAGKIKPYDLKRRKDNLNEVYVYYECSDLKEYNNYKEWLFRKILEHKMPLDIDHIIPTFRFTIEYEKLLDKLITKLKDYGILYEYDYANKYGYKALTLDYPNFVQINNIENFPIMIREGVEKIRIYINKHKQSVSFVPIVFHGVLDADIDFTNCIASTKIWKKSGFCNLLKSQNKTGNMLKNCFECINFNISNIYLYNFLNIIGKLNLGLEFDSLNEFDFKAQFFHSKTSEIKDIRKKIHNSFNGTIYENPFEIGAYMAPFKPKDIIDISKDKIHFSTPENLRLSSTISLIEKKINDENNNGNIRYRKGVTFSQLKEYLSDEMSPSNISRSLDISLDEALLKPITQKIEITINSNIKNCWSRGYRPAGEDISKLLLRYYKFAYT